MADAAVSESQLRELRTDLERLQGELGAQLEQLDDDSRPVQLDQQMVGRLSRMDAMQQQQMAQASRSHIRAHLNRVTLALKAMDSGDFGYCRSCDEAIPFPRLKARPDSPLCVRCQQLNEQ